MVPEKIVEKGLNMKTYFWLCNVCKFFAKGPPAEISEVCDTHMCDFSRKSEEANKKKLKEELAKLIQVVVDQENASVDCKYEMW